VRARVPLYLNVFSFDDDELTTVRTEKAKDPNVTMLVTLKKSPAAGKHERQLIEARPADRGWSCCVQHAFRHRPIGDKADQPHQRFCRRGQGRRRRVDHWSASCEGTFVVAGHPGGSGYKVQNNTQSVFTDTDSARF